MAIAYVQVVEGNTAAGPLTLHLTNVKAGNTLLVQTAAANPADLPPDPAFDSAGNVYRKVANDYEYVAVNGRKMHGRLFMAENSQTGGLAVCGMFGYRDYCELGAAELEGVPKHQDTP